MKVNELMIGDLVYYIHTEDGIAPYKEVICIQAEDLCRDACIIETHYEPIPLTAEILEKNGFVYNAIPFVDGWEQFGLALYRGGNGYRIDCGINVSLIIDSVHQLQHALRLCGIEHEIIL